MDTTQKKELSRAINSLARRPRTKNQVINSLEGRNLNEARIAEIVDELTRLGLLDDCRYADGYARSRLERGYGPEKIIKELVKMGIAEDLAVNTLSSLSEDFPEADILRAAAAKRLRINGEPSEPKELKNLHDFLIRRGFNSELVRVELKPYYDRILGERE